MPRWNIFPRIIELLLHHHQRRHHYDNRQLWKLKHYIHLKIMPRWNIFSGIIELLLLRVIHSSSDELQKPKVRAKAIIIIIIITIMIVIIFSAKVIIITVDIIITSSPRCAWRRRRRRKRRREFLRRSPQHGRLKMLDMSWDVDHLQVYYMLHLHVYYMYNMFISLFDFSLKTPSITGLVGLHEASCKKRWTWFGFPLHDRPWFWQYHLVILSASGAYTLQKKVRISKIPPEHKVIAKWHRPWAKTS